MTSTPCTARTSAKPSAQMAAPAVQLRQMTQFMLRQGKRSWWMVILLWMSAIAPAFASLDFRVAIEQDVSQVKVGSSTPAVLKDIATGQEVGTVPAMNAVVAEARNGRVAFSQKQVGALWIEPSDGGYVFIGDDWYRGRVLVVPTTYALYQRQTSGNSVFDVGDTTRWQVYHGLSDESAETRAAVDSTTNLVVTYNGQLINAVFHACSGGHTLNSEDVWSGALPYLRGVQDYDLTVQQALANCQPRSTPITAQQLRDAIPGIGRILGLRAEQGRNGRISQVTVTGESGQKVLTGVQLRTALKLRAVPVRIEVSQTGEVAAASNPPIVPTEFVFLDEGGFGHGVGMSQWGAWGMAQMGQNFQQILLHYYTGVQLSQLEVQ
ncbi:MAG: SpoIID/LytB domain-containing protein [Oculatellaceae cyanobacterium Prado106]|nr:SpoIID/LytB domain-containing protein [Oculatellaceae cyanobacterium Prado106]